MQTDLPPDIALKAVIKNLPAFGIFFLFQSQPAFFAMITSNQPPLDGDIAAKAKARQHKTGEPQNSRPRQHPARNTQRNNNRSHRDDIAQKIVSAKVSILLDLHWSCQSLHSRPPNCDDRPVTSKPHASSNSRASHCYLASSSWIFASFNALAGIVCPPSNAESSTLKPASESMRFNF